MKMISENWIIFFSLCEHVSYSYNLNDFSRDHPNVISEDI